MSWNSNKYSKISPALLCLIQHAAKAIGKNSFDDWQCMQTMAIFASSKIHLSLNYMA